MFCQGLLLGFRFFACFCIFFRLENAYKIPFFRKKTGFSCQNANKGLQIFRKKRHELRKKRARVKGHSLLILLFLLSACLTSRCALIQRREFLPSWAPLRLPLRQQRGRWRAPPRERQLPLREQLLPLQQERLPQPSSWGQPSCG